MIALSDLWLGDVRAAGQPNPERVRALVDLLKGRHAHTVPAVTVLVGRRGQLTAEGDHAADRIAALREVYAGTLKRLDRLERLGRVQVQVQEEG